MGYAQGLLYAFNSLYVMVNIAVMKTLKKEADFIVFRILTAMINSIKSLCLKNSKVKVNMDLTA